MKNIPYDRAAAVAYAERWALSRNPAYYNFDPLGGDCTNFISQCIYAGCGVMNYTPNTGWYYAGLNSLAPAWTGVDALYRFLMQNRGVGPFAKHVAQSRIAPGDAVQLGTADGRFYHSLLVLSPSPPIYIAAHTDDSLWRPLNSYHYEAIRYLHIEGARTY